MTVLDGEEVHSTEEKSGLRTTSTVILAIVATAAGLFFGREFFIPIVFAVLLNAIFRPVVRFFERLRLPTPLGAGIVVLALIGVMVGGGFALSGPLQRWMHDAPARLEAAEKKLNGLRAPVQQVT